MNKKLLTIPLIAIVILIAGFYLVLNNLNELQTDLKNLKLAVELISKQKEQSTTPVPTAPESATPAPTPAVITSVSIPTSILFTTLSGQALLPQTQISVMVEDITKSSDGTVGVKIKAFTSEASSYSTIEPRDLFELINLNGANQRSYETKGQFNSMPPQTSVSGTLYFKIEPSQNTIILQIGSGDQIKYYEFNFLKKTYKETIVG